MAAAIRHGSFHGGPAEGRNDVLVEYGIFWFLFLGFWDGAF